MAKHKVLKSFRDIHTNVVYKENAEVELSEERAAEVHENLKEKGVFIELIPGQEPDGEKFDREAAKERLKGLGVEFNGNSKNEVLQQLLEEHDKSGQEDDNQVGDGE